VCTNQGLVFLLGWILGAQGFSRSVFHARGDNRMAGFNVVYFSAADAHNSLSASLFALESTTALLGLSCPSGFHCLCHLFFGLSTSEVRCGGLLVCREVRSASFSLGIEIARVFIFLAGARRQGCFISHEATWDARFQVRVLRDGSARLVFFCCCLPLGFVSPRRGAHCLSSLLGFVPFCRCSFLLDFYSAVCGL
jgi:hypothetical protein